MQYDIITQALNTNFTKYALADVLSLVLSMDLYNYLFLNKYNNILDIRSNTILYIYLGKY